MRELDPKDLSWAVRLLPEEVKNLMTRYYKRIVLGGGYLRATIANEKVNDLDLFTSSALESKLYADLLAKDAGRKVYETENAYSLRLPKGSFVQFIHRWTFPNPEALIQSFDFTIACAAIWVQSSTKWTSLADDNFYSDLAAKRLMLRAGHARTGPRVDEPGRRDGRAHRRRQAADAVRHRRAEGRYLPAMATGELRATMALTEPGGGSDLQSMSTTARADGDEL